MIDYYQQWLQHMIDLAKKHAYVYTIELKKNQHDWYVLAVSPPDDRLMKVFWTSSLNSAQLFLTEQEVEEFKSDYISPRKVSIVRMPTSIGALLTLA